jgi:hypothetical protein
LDHPVQQMRYLPAQIKKLSVRLHQRKFILIK